MQGKQTHQRELFSTIDLESFIPKDYLLRKVDKLLDLEFLYELTKELYCVDNGRTSIDPVLFFRMQLISYLFGIESDRQLCRDIHLNLAYRWFCRLPLDLPVPHHSSLTRIRDRMGESRYRQIFQRILLQWQKEGRFTGKQIVADATLVKANASMGSLVKREDAAPNARVLRQYEKQYHDFQHGKRKRRVAHQTHVSASDPDATMVYRKGTEGGLKYKVHYIADVKTRIITDCYTTPGATHEGFILPYRIDYLCDEMGFDVQEAIADRGYGRGPTYSSFRQRKIRTYIHCTMLASVKENLRPLRSSITVKLIDTNVQKGIFSTLMRNWITGRSNDTESRAATVANAASEQIAYPIQPEAELGLSIGVRISMKSIRFVHGKKPELLSPR